MKDRWIARFLKSRGTDRVFGLQGGHIQPIWDHVARLGIRIIDVRDEGAALHMAHAHAELTGQLGVCMVTAGPGVTKLRHRHGERLPRSGPRAVDRRVHVATTGKYGTAPGHSARGHPAAGVSAITDAACS